MKRCLMKLYYITLQGLDVQKAERLSQVLLVKHRQAIWTDLFSINHGSAQGDITEQNLEVGLILYTQAGYRQEIERVICEAIGNQEYLIAEISPESANTSFRKWLDSAVPRKHL